MKRLLTLSTLLFVAIVVILSVDYVPTDARDDFTSVSSSASSTVGVAAHRSNKPRTIRSSAPSAEVFRPPESIPVLVYHHIRITKPYHPSTWSYKMSVSPEIFRKQMEWIRDHGYTTISLDEFAAIRNGTMQSPAKPIVITFDDNQRTQYEIAYPLLRSMGMKGVFYLVSNRLQNDSFIVEKEVREMVDAGMDIQSHSVTHSMLTNLSAVRLVEELTKSREALEAVTGKPVRHIAYPLTSHNQRVRDATRDAGYVTGTIMDPRWAKQTDDSYKIPRYMMTDDTNLSKVLP